MSITTVFNGNGIVRCLCVEALRHELNPGLSTPVIYSQRVLRDYEPNHLHQCSRGAGWSLRTLNNIIVNALSRCMTECSS